LVGAGQSNKTQDGFPIENVGNDGIGEDEFLPKIAGMTDGKKWAGIFSLCAHLGCKSTLPPLRPSLQRGEGSDAYKE
jgi:Rieske Fe-S protein